METINIIFPNQLFENSVLLNSEYSHYLIEYSSYLGGIRNIDEMGLTNPDEID